MLSIIILSERVDAPMPVDEAAGFTDQWRQNRLSGGARYKSRFGSLIQVN